MQLYCFSAWSRAAPNWSLTHSLTQSQQQQQRLIRTHFLCLCVLIISRPNCSRPSIHVRLSRSIAQEVAAAGFIRWSNWRGNPSRGLSFLVQGRSLGSGRAGHPNARLPSDLQEKQTTHGHCKNGNSMRRTRFCIVVLFLRCVPSVESCRAPPTVVPLTPHHHRRCRCRPPNLPLRAPPPSSWMRFQDYRFRGMRNGGSVWSAWCLTRKKLVGLLRYTKGRSFNSE